MTSNIILLTLVVSLLGACSSNHPNDKEGESVVISAEQAPTISMDETCDFDLENLGSGDFLISVDSLHHVTFNDTLEGYMIAADFVPDTVYSKNVGHIKYVLSDARGTQYIATTYNNFYSRFNARSTSRHLSKTAFGDSLSKSDLVPFKFFDVDFDGIKEFVVIHEGYNCKYYEVFKKDRFGHFIKMYTPPYNQIVNGYNASTTFDQKEKTITIDQSSGFTSRSAVYQLLGIGSKKHFQCIEKSLVDQVGVDSIQYTTWALVNHQLKIVSQKINPK